MNYECDECRERLRWWEVFLSWSRRGTLSYPVRTLGGGRMEQSRRWLCRACTRRGDDHREEMERDSG